MCLLVRDGRTREHYARQKSQCYAYFRVNPADSQRMAGAQFTIYDFISNAFSFSHTKKEAAVAVLLSLKEGPKPFSHLLTATGVKKSTLYLLCLALEKSGMIEKTGGRDSPYSLSPAFGAGLEAYAGWWKRWAGN